MTITHLILTQLSAVAPMTQRVPEPLTQSPELALAGFDLFLSLAVVMGVGVFYLLYLTLAPLIEAGDISNEEWSRLEDHSLALLRRRDRVIDELKDLEFEAAMDKLDDRDLTELRQRYRREALSLIEELERNEQLYLKKPGDSQESAQEESPAQNPTSQDSEEQPHED